VRDLEQRPSTQPILRKATRSTAPRNPFDPLDGEVDQTIDLHGYSGVEARVHAAELIRAAQRRSPGGLLHIITGKGRNSSAGPVLKPLVKAVLSSSAKSIVAEWGPDDSGGGFLVRLSVR
jgi:DNA-nicking Smr family endonuclease